VIWARKFNGKKGNFTLKKGNFIEDLWKNWARHKNGQNGARSLEKTFF
jgi:hypothetical protein